MKLTAILAFYGLILTIPAKAELINYTFTTMGYGSLGGTTFNNAAVIITATADTSQITFNPTFGADEIVDLSSSIYISGLGSADFTSTLDFVNQSFGAVGISENPNFIDILDCDNPVFDTYDLGTAIGPVSGTSQYNPVIPFETTAGQFLLQYASPVTFQAVIVPEPSALALGTLGGVLGLLTFFRRK